MQLKKLEVIGFKSFADRTEFVFEPGITAFVGPNGCGKSNIVDAVKWVLGEQSAKSLRGKEMQDVIFNGAGSRKPVGYAEVSLTIGNNRGILPIDYDEVCITRRLHRTGESEYMINKKPCRLRDIRELFFDTGVGTSAYSVIEQGKVDILIQANPKDRRLVFEEAAGITKFRVQKKQALAKLERVSLNLSRVTDIIDEVQRQLRSVRYQAAKARKFKTYSDRLKQIRVAHSLYRYRGLSEERIQAEMLVRQLEGENAELVRRLAGISARQDELEREILEREEAIRTANEQLNRVRDDLRGAEQEIVSNRNRIDDARRHREAQSGQAAALERRIAELAEDLAKAAKEIEAAEAQREHLAGALDVRRSAVDEVAFVCAALEEEIEASREAFFGLTRRESDLQGRISVLAGNRTSLENTLVRRQRDLEERSRRADQLAGSRRQVEDQIQQTRLQLESLRREASEKQTLLAGIHARIEQIAGELAEMNAERRGKEGRRQILRDLESRAEGVSSGVRRILEGARGGEGPAGGVRGMVADLMKVDIRYAAAVEAAIGARAESIVLGSTDEALADIALLRSDQTGRAGFLPMDRLRAQVPPGSIAGPGILCRALDVVRFDEAHAPVFELLLGDTWIAESLEAARAVEAPWGCRFVTLEGDILEADGPIVGGQKDVGGLISRRSELEALEREIAQLDADIAARGRLLDEQKAEQQSVARLAAELQAEAQRAAIALTAQEGQAGQIDQQTETLREDIDLLAAEIGVVTRDIEENAAKSAETSQEHERLVGELQELSLKMRERQTALEQKRAEHKQAGDMLAELSRQLVSVDALRSGLSGRRQIHEEELRARRRELADLAALQTGLAEQERTAEQAILAAQERIGALRQGESTLCALLAKYEGERDGFRREAHELKTAADEAGKGRGDFEERLQTARLAVSECRLKMESMTERILEDYRVDLTAFDLTPEEWLLRPLLLPQPVAAPAPAETGETAAQPAAEGAAQGAAQGAAEKGAQPAPEAPAAPVPAADAVQPAEAAAEGETVPAQAAQPAAPALPSVTIEEMKAYRESVMAIVCDPATDWDALSREIDDLRRRIAGLGPVNLDAIREQDELETREQFLTTQRDDLDAARKNEEEIIRNLDKMSTERFLETFEQIRASFHDMFRRLFGGGKADIMLEADVDVLDAGIDIVARPPGKEPRSISLLSGGEKALTAVALLFAIFKSKPSPFCLLDEVDAPLDESNTARVAMEIQEFARESQFIVITHNKRTMAVADVLYGVTQEEKGVSKRIAVRLEDVDEQIEMMEQSAEVRTAVAKAG